jgi:hypothetical protein
MDPSPGRSCLAETPGAQLGHEVNAPDEPRQTSDPVRGAHQVSRVQRDPSDPPRTMVAPLGLPRENAPDDVIRVMGHRERMRRSA